MEFEKPLAGKYKNLSDAENGIKEQDATIGRLKAEADAARKQLEELSKPPEPKFKDDGGFEAQMKASGIDFAALASGVKTGKFDAAAVKKVGQIIKGGDDEFVGRKTLELQAELFLHQLDAARDSAKAKFGGKEKVDPLLKYVDGLPDTDPFKGEFKAEWSATNRTESALERLLGRVAREKGTDSFRSTAESSQTHSGSTGATAFTVEEARAARKAAIAKYGFADQDPDFMRRAAATPPHIMRESRN